ncbi:MAG: zinc carboxypeptidase, partial [Bdellovibrio sp.]
YRGVEGAPMEVESQALVHAVQKELQHSSFVLTLDVHSGFGFQDRLWFPYAKTIRPFPDLPLVYSLKSLLDRTYPNHFYRVEPQAQSYTTHGDIWDYLYDTHLQKTQAGESGKYLPLCLEMGSWLWVKKNPWQIFRAEGPFNPSQGHRQQRILRRHNTLMEF